MVNRSSRRACPRMLGLLAAVAWLALGCSAQPTPHIDGVPGFGAGRDAGEPDSGLDPEPLAYGVISRNREDTVTSVALLRPDGTLLRQTFVHSGSAPAGLVTALSGDVVLPTRSGDPRTLTLLDRYRTDVVTRIDVETGQVLGQARAQARAPQSGAFSSNPQDFLYLDPSHAFISRYNPNPRVAGSDPNAGNDLRGLDPTAMALSDARIDFSPLDGEAERENLDTGEREQVHAYARPSRMVRLGERFAVVGCTRENLAYDAAAEGLVGLVDLAAGSVRGVALPGLANCPQVMPLPDDDTRVAVACIGLLIAGVSKRDEAGLALLQLQGEELAIERIWRAQDAPDDAIAVFGLVPVGGDVMVAAAVGDTDAGTHDALYRLDLGSGAQQRLFEAGGAFVLGDGAYNPRAGLLFVPDASADGDGRPTAGVQRFLVMDAQVVEHIDTIEVDDALPARQVAPL